MVYGCDGPWWVNRSGLPDFRGTKLAHDTPVCATYRDVHKIEVVEGDQLHLNEPGTVGSGGNSGFQALNLAVQFGATRILLIGFDMHTARGLHWYGPNVGKGMRNPHDHSFTRWRRAFDGQAPVLRALGVEVLNASPDSALTCFEQVTVGAAMTRWEV